MILKDPNVKAILVNIFGGIVRCDRVAQGVVDCIQEYGKHRGSDNCKTAGYKR